MEPAVFQILWSLFRDDFITSIGQREPREIEPGEILSRHAQTNIDVIRLIIRISALGFAP